MAEILEYSLDDAPIQVRRCMNYFLAKYLHHIALPCWIAGGAIRDYFTDRKVHQDIDLFVPNKELYEEVCKKLKTNEYFDGHMFFESKNAAHFNTRQGKIDVIKKFMPTPAITAQRFDFTICMAAVSFPVRFYHHPDYFLHLGSHDLVINDLEHPMSVMRRVQKYTRYGFRMHTDEMLKLVEAVRRMPTVNMGAFYPDITGEGE